MLSERRRSEQQRKQLKQIRTEYDELLASINAVIDRCPDELKDDLKNELEAERIWQREVKVAKANIKYFTERVDEASSFEDLARVPLAFRPMDMYVDENGKFKKSAYGCMLTLKTAAYCDTSAEDFWISRIFQACTR